MSTHGTSYPRITGPYKKYRRAGQKGTRRFVGYYGRSYDPDRRPRQRDLPLGTRNKLVAEDRLRQIRELVEARRFDPWRDALHGAFAEFVTAKEALRRYVLHCQQEGQAENTLKSKFYTLHALLRLLPSPQMDICSVTAAHVKSCIEAPSTRKGVKKAPEQATRHLRWNRLRAFFHWMVSTGIIAYDPMDELRPVKTSKKLRDWFTAEELEQLTACVRAEAEVLHQGHEQHREWFVHLTWLCYLACFRVNEAISLRWKNVRLGAPPSPGDPPDRIDYGYLLLKKSDGFVTKNRQEDAVPVSRPLAQLLWHCRESDAHGPDDFVVQSRGAALKREQAGRRATRKVSYGSAKRLMQHYRTASHLRDTLTLHSLRHGGITALVESGAPLPYVQQIARHRNIQTTMRYVHASPVATRYWMQQAFAGVTPPIDGSRAAPDLDEETPRSTTVPQTQAFADASTGRVYAPGAKDPSRTLKKRPFSDRNAEAPRGVHSIAG